MYQIVGACLKNEPVDWMQDTTCLDYAVAKVLQQ